MKGGDLSRNEKLVAYAGLAWYSTSILHLYV